MRYPESTGSSLFTNLLAFFEISVRMSDGLAIPGMGPFVAETYDRILEESKIRAITSEGSLTVKLNLEPAL
jgi:hypothetical protein